MQICVRNAKFMNWGGQLRSALGYVTKKETSLVKVDNYWPIVLISLESSFL